MADAEGVNETLQRDLAPRHDCGKQVTHGGLAEAFDLLQADFVVAVLKGENLGRLLDPAALVEQLDLLVAKPVNVEGAARHEMLEMLDDLIGTSEFTGAAGDRAFFAGRGLIADHFAVQRTRAAGGKFVRLGAARTLL